jgi:hypothetical protein
MTNPITPTNHEHAADEQGPDLLGAIEALRNDTATQVQRLQGLLKSGQLTPELLSEEVCETFLPLVQDVVERIYEVQFMAQDFGNDVAKKLWPDGEGDDGDDEITDGLWPEDAKAFKALFAGYRQLLMDLANRESDEATKATALQTMQVVEQAMTRVDELAIEDEDEDDDDDDDDDEDGDEDGEPEPTN